MNFLAHAYLSFNHPQIIVGNMVSDFVKGKQKYEYPLMIQKGIQLHRDIDTFTDNHPATAKAKEIFRPHYRLYSGALVDVIYDYFLANDQYQFHTTSLFDFAAYIYTVLEEEQQWLPLRFKAMLPYMKKDNWLYNYQHKDGIKKSLNGLVRRATYLTESETALELLQVYEPFLLQCYQEFFPDVKQMAKARMQELLG